MTTIDTKDLIERAEELREIIGTDPDGGLDEDRDELAAIEALAKDVYGWNDGVTLILEDDFEEYAQELAEMIGAIPRDAGWPCDCIDWSEAAASLRGDYKSVEFQGTTYLYETP